MKYLTLIVDDEPHSLSLLRNTFKAKQFEVVTATHPEEATRCLELYLPHILVVDISLGAKYKSGLDWLASVRKGPYKDIPALVITSSNSVEHIKRAMSLDINDYILKPFDYNILNRKLHLIVKKLEEKPLYSFKPKDDLESDGKIEVDGLILGVNEVGVCSSGYFSTQKPVGGVEFSSPFFHQMGLDTPQLRLLGSVPETRKSTGYPFRSYFRVVEWAQKEPGTIDKWIEMKHLQKII